VEPKVSNRYKDCTRRRTALAVSRERSADRSAKSVLDPWPSFQLVPLNPCKGGQAQLRVYLVALTVRGCPAVKDGLEGDLARLQQ
jgi:hypothetical protein